MLVKYDVFHICDPDGCWRFYEVFKCLLLGFLFRFLCIFLGYLDNYHLVFGVFKQFSWNLLLNFVEHSTSLNTDNYT